MSVIKKSKRFGRKKRIYSTNRSIIVASVGRGSIFPVFAKKLAWHSRPIVPLRAPRVDHRAIDVHGVVCPGPHWNRWRRAEVRCETASALGQRRRPTVAMYYLRGRDAGHPTDRNVAAVPPPTDPILDAVARSTPHMKASPSIPPSHFITACCTSRHSWFVCASRVRSGQALAREGRRSCGSLTAEDSANSTQGL